MNESKPTYFNLTQSQLSLWTSQKLHYNIPLHNVVHTFEISGPINEKVFEATFQELINAIEVLRSVFTELEGIPFQSFLEPWKFELETIDFSKQDLKLNDWVSKRASKNFDISTGVFDTVLLRIEEEKYIWFLNMHHLITDGATTSLLYDQMSATYSNILNDSLEIPIPFNSFEDYLSFEKEEQNNPNHEVNRSFWKAKMEEMEDLPQLYGNKNSAKSTSAERITIPLDNELSNQLKEIAKHPDLRGWTQKSTIFNIVSTIFLILINKVSGQNKIAIGTTAHNRTTKKFLRTPGFFMEVFPLLNEVKDEDTILNVYQRVKSEVNDFLKNVKPGLAEPNMGRSYNTLLNYILTSFSDFNGYPTKSEWIFTGHISRSNLIELHVVDFDNTGNFQLHFDLKDEVFTTELKHYLTKHFINILNVFIENKGSKLKDISLITREEVEKIEGWNNTTVIFDETETLLSKFDDQVKKSPDAIALIFANETYTYQALNKKANQVANLLISKGVRTNDIIAVSLDRSIEMIVYIYGIIKAGAAYLPIDTTLPEGRVKFIANDANFHILFFNHDNLNLEFLEGVECLDIRKIENHLVTLDTIHPHIINSREDLAYVIYTSGSTGEPKGVECHHKGINNRLNWMNRDYPINENDTLLQKTPITFDVSLWELFWPLQVGAKLVIEKPDAHKDPYKLIQSIKKNNVSVIHFVPSMLSVFVQTKNVDECISLRRLFCSGEALNASIVEKTYEKLGQISIYNLYGPTEASVDVTSWHCKKEELNKGIPIGYPVANTKIYILDDNLKMLPIGVKGELCIGGIQVAAGYLNREQITKEKFVNDIFSKVPNTKMYKTGDLARYRSDGAIEYHGRNDDQIKIRGIRIELGEIEKVIEQQLDVIQVVVIADKKDNLICYYTGNNVVENQAKNTLRGFLPEYMIPIHFKNLEVLPLTENGKINRFELIKLDTSSMANKTDYVSPQTEIEELLAEIWQEVLEVTKVGVYDNFIALGGHSLTAIRITSRINKVIEFEFKLNKIFELPTIVEYASYIEETLVKLLEE